eukprot:4266358-Amphidinium_carterae.1
MWCNLFGCSGFLNSFDQLCASAVGATTKHCNWPYLTLATLRNAIWGNKLEHYRNLWVSGSRLSGPTCPLT